MKSFTPNLTKTLFGKLIPLSFYIILLILFTPAGRPATAAPPAQAPDLFSPTNAQNDTNPAETDPTIVRSRFVEVNFDTLTGLDSGPGGQFIGENTLRLNLFDDVVFTAVLDQLKTNNSGSQTWIGHLEGQEDSEVILVFKDGVLVGNIVPVEGFYQVRYHSDNIHSIRQINQLAFPPEAEPVIPEGLSEESPTEASDINATACSQIDILVAYTQAARQDAGGTTAMEDLIDLAVEETNQGYQNSDIYHRMNLVHTVEVNYSEAGADSSWWSTALSRLRGTSDGYMDNVHSLRDLHGADLVTLIVNDKTYCGLAYLTQMPAYGFSVVAKDCATGYYSFGHETGHNLGALHDRNQYSGGSDSKYYYGYQDPPPDKSFRTVMAYNCPGGCARRNYWSNPDITYNGKPTGIDHAVDPENSADNARWLDEHSCNVAGYRTPANLEPEAYLPIIIKN